MGITRRRLAGAAVLGAGALTLRPALAASVRHVAALDYGLAETMLALGTAPVAMPDVPGWATWVVEPSLPSCVVNLGADQEVNLELLASLMPDLILTTPFLDDLNPILARIAPCERLILYEDGAPGPFARAEAALRRVAALLGRIEWGEVYLGATVDQFAADRIRLAALPPAPLLLVDFTDARHVRAYASNSLWQDALDRLGLVNAWRRPTTSWGFSTIGIEALAEVPEHTLLATVAPVPPDVLAVLDESALWRALPFVRQNRILRLPSAFSFGGIPSARRFARLLTDRLLAMPPT